MTKVKETFLSGVLSILEGKKDHVTFGATKMIAYDGLDIIEGLPTMTLVDGKIGLGLVGSDLYFETIEIVEDQISVISAISKAFEKCGINTNNC